MIPAKICGITRLEDALVAAELGAAAIGFIFYPRSPRYIEASAAGRISEQLPQRMARVGVFVNPDAETMRRTAEIAHLTHIQLHGDENTALCEQSSLPVIKAVRNWIEFEKYETFSAAAFLVDSKTAGQFGGNGQKSDWNFCRQVRERAPVILAGGLAMNNIASAIAAATPDAVDLSSAVEHAPGIKDHQKLQEFFVTLHSCSKPDRRRMIFQTL